MMSRGGSDRRSEPRRWEDRPWTAGEQRAHEGDIGAELGKLDAKLDRLTWLVAVGAGIVAASAFAVGIISQHWPA